MVSIGNKIQVSNSRYSTQGGKYYTLMVYQLVAYNLNVEHYFVNTRLNYITSFFATSENDFMIHC